MPVPVTDLELRLARALEEIRETPWHEYLAAQFRGDESEWEHAVSTRISEVCLKHGVDDLSDDEPDGTGSQKLLPTASAVKLRR